MGDQKKIPAALSFATGGLGGIGGWIMVHPFNTVAVRMNLATASGAVNELGFVPFARDLVNKEGFMSLYTGLGAGITRQIFYATARLGLFESMRDEVAKYRPMDIWSRLGVGVVTGSMAAVIACPAEVSLVRMSNDKALPVDQRRNYKSVLDCGLRIAKEDGVTAFWRGAGPFVSRAALVGACQVGTYDQFRSMLKNYGFKSEIQQVFGASMMSGLLYSVVTNPFESAKNRMAFQRPDPVTGKLPYTGTMQTIAAVAKADGPLALWNGFWPYYLRCGGHTVGMFVIVDLLRKAYFQYA
mmetsp:Transcript_41191/g.99565  ORF Transcript_41191/g.99565 Transcript_41191/m.99565 type:complete len:298 (-) Transcript_41191:138-1031(-)|eukprot:CAMPEP_0114153176 /NCGR_PEP_ID=MMETSP0043_2-20121206/24210_1 /TAXON_ID=464988 /ORGANISM="Hemiselmis andersenii, Strain CCMP644" /LENGTH=297 /DNA_ID=CAMNT_0001248183 /DNA_START=35 /DNA_END=928 /DNA_ORIENTATION=+